MAIRIHHRGMANTLWTYIRPQTVWTRTLSNEKNDPQNRTFDDNGLQIHQMGSKWVIYLTWLPSNSLVCSEGNLNPTNTLTMGKRVTPTLMYRNFVRNSTSWYKIYVGFYVKCEFTTLATEIRNRPKFNFLVQNIRRILREI